MQISDQSARMINHPLSSSVTPMASLPPSPQTRYSAWPVTPTHQQHSILTLMDSAVPALASFHPPQSPRCPVSYSSGQASLSGAPGGQLYSFMGRCTEGVVPQFHQHSSHDALEHSGGSAISSIAPHPLDSHRFAGRDLTPPPKLSSVAATNTAMMSDELYLANGSIAAGGPADSLSTPISTYRSFGQRPHSFAALPPVAATDFSSPSSPIGSQPRRHSSGLQAHFDSASDNPLREASNSTTADLRRNHCASPETAGDPLIASVTSFGEHTHHHNQHRAAAALHSSSTSSIPTTFYRGTAALRQKSAGDLHVAFSSAYPSVMEEDLPLPTIHERKRMLHFGGILDDSPNMHFNDGVSPSMGMFNGSSASPFSRSASVAGFSSEAHGNKQQSFMGVVQRALDTPSHWGSLKAPPALESLE
ncbi:Hypothetical protein, putative [Bodo saltans]|uniref:Uncharacterized protein n=1 Tax=Bodo saltans TaxID=75058 RepID=A0A0S4IMT5_BODSA|nr:Hypothetical protein, putative [Bodo saltans]|eukprot:CUE68612.1 Hypothetical protein, putative [Bodo saltans]